MKINHKDNSKKRFSYLETPENVSTITSDKLGNYSNEVIYYARQLKYQHEKDYVPENPDSAHPDQRHSDDYYLECAQKYYNLDRLKSFAALMKKACLGVDTIPDSDWSVYSYEEIIQMANNGVYVPEEVLHWAMAQREADVTSYVVVTDDANNDNNSSTEEVSADSDINNLRNIAKQNIVKSVNQQEVLDLKNDEVQNLTQKALRVKAETKSFKGRSQETKLARKTKRLQELDQKSKEQKLNPFEKKELKKLRRELGEESSIRQEMQKKTQELESFLNSFFSKGFNFCSLLF